MNVASLEVRPDGARPYLLDGADRDSVLPRYVSTCDTRRARGVRSANLQHLLGGQNSLRVPSSAKRTVLHHHVQRVVGSGAQEQADFCVDAAPYVAVVQHAQTRWNRTVHQRPCVAVGEPLCLVPIHLGTTDHAVPVSVEGGGPDDARYAWDRYRVTGEPFWHRDHWVGHLPSVRVGGDVR